MLLNIFLYHFNDFFVLLVGLNFACVYLTRPAKREEVSGNNHFFFDVIDAISGKAIENITSKIEKSVGEIGKQLTKIDIYLSAANKDEIDNETTLTLSAYKQILKNNYTGSNKNIIDELASKYKDKIKKKTASLHLPVICGLLGSYGILILLYAAIDYSEKQPAMTLFLFCSDVLILAFLFVCILAEGDIWFKEREYPMRFNICRFFNKIFHPRIGTTLIVFIVIFTYFLLSVSNVVNVDTPVWMTDRIIIYITLTVSVSSFLGYLIWNNIYSAYKTLKYKNEECFKECGRDIKAVDKFMHKHKAEFDKLDKKIEEFEKGITEENFSLTKNE